MRTWMMVVAVAMMLVVSAAHAAPWQYLQGTDGAKIQHLTFDFGKHTSATCRTTDGTNASTKVTVGAKYKVMSTYGGRQPYWIADVKVVKASGVLATAEVLRWVD